jgi:hypothetical protein
MWASCEAPHGEDPPLQPRDAVVSTSATLPAPAAMEIGVASVRSGVGSGLPTGAFDASSIR